MGILDHYWSVNERVRGMMIVLGLILGMIIVSESVQRPNSRQCLAMLFTASLTFGGVVSTGISVAYRKKFPNGVPRSTRSGYISPSYYGIAVRRHFVEFTYALVGVVAFGVLDRLVRFLLGMS